MTVQWELPGQLVSLTFEVLEERDAYEAQMERYRRTLWGALGLLTVLLISGQALALGLWGLRPLRELAADINRVESGATDQLGGPYPREGQALTDSLDTLLQSEKVRRERVRNTLSDLAHSLKTPLAVIRGADPKTFHVVKGRGIDAVDAKHEYSGGRRID